MEEIKYQTLVFEFKQEAVVVFQGCGPPWTSDLRNSQKTHEISQLQRNTNQLEFAVLMHSFYDVSHNGKDKKSYLQLLFCVCPQYICFALKILSSAENHWKK